MGALVSFGQSVPDVFADEVIGFENINGTIRIRFAVASPSEPVPPAPVQLEIIGRLIMPTAGAQKLCLALYDFLKNQGLDPSALVGGGETAQ